MKTKMDKMNKKSIKSKFIKNIALTLVLSMTVFVACQKEVGIVPNTSPAANNGLANKEVAFSPGIYDQAAEDPLFKAYYDAYEQLKAPFYNKLTNEGRSIEVIDRLLASFNTAIENEDFEQIAELMDYESLDCFNATIANLNSAGSKLIQKYPFLANENSGAMEMTIGIFFENYLRNNPAARLGGYNSLLARVECGSGCISPRVPDQECCNKAIETCQNTNLLCASTAAAGLIACLGSTVAYPICAAAVLLLEVACLEHSRRTCNTALKFCCKDPKPNPREVNPWE